VIHYDHVNLGFSRISMKKKIDLLTINYGRSCNRRAKELAVDCNREIERSAHIYIESVNCFICDT
jgi:hypothetical protein